MATLATAKTLTVKITEDITLNGVQQGNTTTDTVSSISQIYKRIVTVPANDGDSDESDDEVTLIMTTGGAGSTVAAGTFVVGDMKYCRITNLNTGAGEGVVIQISRDTAGDDTDEETAWLLVEEGKSLIINTFASAFDAKEAALANYALADISDIRAVAEGTTAVDVEIFIASS